MADQKHLCNDSRLVIEHGLNDRLSFKQIARQIDKDCTTISKEVKNRRLFIETGAYGRSFNNCIHRKKCKVSGCCSDCTSPRLRFCGSCAKCIKVCPHYEKEFCGRLNTPPYVCNGCDDRSKCTLEKAFYHASEAQKEYRENLSESRSGVNLTEEQLARLTSIIGPLVDNGQSIHHICANHASEIMRCERTIYSYVNNGILEGVKSIDLVRAVKFRPRKQKKSVLKVDKSCRINRTFQDFQTFMKEHPDLPYTEIDSVEGKKGCAVLLTCHFVQAKFQLAFRRDANDSKSVTDAFNKLYDTLGPELYHELFYIILADNGTEFSDPKAIEFDKNGIRRSYVFYCDPEAPGQKGHCEHNHTFIRRVIPKGTDLTPYSQDQITLMMSHINSYKRKDLGNKSPCELIAFMYGEDSLKKFNISFIAPDEICLKPSLLSR
ncbi:MAG: IS30 family transposase [Lachnospiraceae bacterium]|nr:IS30 family transposase [Lachnospiraceae bacterium]